MRNSKNGYKTICWRDVSTASLPGRMKRKTIKIFDSPDKIFSALLKK